MLHEEFVIMILLDPAHQIPDCIRTMSGWWSPPSKAYKEQTQPAPNKDAPSVPLQVRGGRNDSRLQAQTENWRELGLFVLCRSDSGRQTDSGFQSGFETKKAATDARREALAEFERKAGKVSREVNTEGQRERSFELDD